MALSSIRPCRCQPILWLSQRHLLFRQSLHQTACGWLPALWIDHQREPSDGYSVPSGCFAFREVHLYPPGQGGEVEYRVDALDPCMTVTILVRASYLALALLSV